MSRTTNGTSVYVDENRFLVVDGIKIGRVNQPGVIELKDKDGRRSRQRGSAFVEVRLDDIHAALRYDFLNPRSE